MKIVLIVSCLEWLTCLFLFINWGNLTVIIQPQLKNGTHFSCYKSLSKRLQCSNEFMFHSHEILCHAVVGDKVLWEPERVQPPPPLTKNCPLAAQLKLTFGDSCVFFFKQEG